jgi:hypothetical protein
MGQEDYFLREIEKIGVLLRALIKKLVSGRENLSITIEKSFEETNEALLSEAGFDLRKILAMNQTGVREYISSFRGINTENLELLADIVFKLGINEEQEKITPFLELALQLLEMCSESDKTYSFERETKIGEIKSLLDDNGRA